MTTLLDATATAELVRSGQASPYEVVQESVERLRRLDPVLGAVVRERYGQALEQARGDLPDGPLRGVPLLLKDLGWHVAGEPTGEGTTFLADLPREQGSWTTQALLSVGAVWVGRSRVPELATTVTTEPAALGPARNPWDPARTAGGSSGGSAAAVAAGLVPVATASDGGGSIRIPAAVCGLVGLKPSRGRISAGPHAGESWAGATTDGVVTRTVRDTALLLDLLAGLRPGDPYTAPPPARPYVQEVGAGAGPLRVGLVARPLQDGLTGDPECADAVLRTGELLEGLGHRVEPVAPAALGDAGFSRAFNRTVGADVALTLLQHAQLLGRPVADEEIEPRNRAYRAMGLRQSATDHLSTRAWLAAWSRRLAEVWQAVDVLVTPVVNGEAPPLGALEEGPDVARWMAWTAQWNVAGNPALSLPLHEHASGLPLGVQLIAPYGREDVLLRVAAQLEQALPWASRLPPLAAG